jgi:serine/threonine protein phosphatase PrpC
MNRARHMESPPEITITAYGKTDVGLIREHNEDNFLIADVTADLRTNEPAEPLSMALGDKGVLFLVCDGMGGAAAGEVASQMAVESIATTMAAATPLPRELFARRLRRAIEDANDRIYAQSRDNQSERGMGTTCTVAALVDRTLVVGQIGDSRCYVLRRGQLAQITKDQSLAWQLMEAGAMTAEEAKAFEHANIILQALGVQERVEVVLSQVELRRGDVVLLSSDGLHGPVSDEEMLQILVEEPDVKKASDRLIARALECEGPDNVTVVLARFDGPDLAEPDPSDVVQFVPYDPGFDPADARRGRGESAEKVTVEVTVPKEVIRMTSSHDEVPAVGAGLALPRGPARPGDHRALFTFLFLTFIAAAAAGAFIRWDRGSAPPEAAAHRATSARASGEDPTVPGAESGMPSGAVER